MSDHITWTPLLVFGCILTGYIVYGDDPGQYVSPVFITLAPGASRSIYSPGYPGSYPNRVTYAWLISAQEGHILGYWFTSPFGIEYDLGCMYDYLELFDGMSADGDQLIDRYCGTGRPYGGTTNGNKLYVLFKSDVNDRNVGFNLTVTEGGYVPPDALMSPVSSLYMVAMVCFLVVGISATACAICACIKFCYFDKIEERRPVSPPSRHIASISYNRVYPDTVNTSFHHCPPGQLPPYSVHPPITPFKRPDSAPPKYNDLYPNGNQAT